MNVPPEAFSHTQHAPCPVCGAEPRRRKWSEYMAHYPVIRSDKHTVMGTRPIPLVCTQCGYVQNFVPPEDFTS